MKDKKFIIGFLLATLLLSSCGKSEDIDLKYSSNVQPYSSYEPYASDDPFEEKRDKITSKKYKKYQKRDNLSTKKQPS